MTIAKSRTMTTFCQAAPADSGNVYIACNNMTADLDITSACQPRGSPLRYEASSSRISS
jgi:hypothetical protein